MTWLTLIGWVWKCTFSCNHARTPVNEGKCYCPDCGRGLIYRWVLLRCGECRVRRESRYYLRRVMPLQRCCLWCGAEDIHTEFLESPCYFQIHRARLVVQEDKEFLNDRVLAWEIYTLSGRWRETWNEVKAHAWAGTRKLLSSPEAQLVRLPASIR